MDETPNLALPYLIAAQAQKHVTHNEALRALDAIVQLSVLDRNLSVPPGSPGDGDRYIAGPSASGEWAGHDGEVAAFQDNAWIFYAPEVGWLCWVADEDKLVGWDGSAWGEVAGDTSEIQNANHVGVYASADDTNRLTVKSDAVLFSHDDVTPGNGGIQHKLNKAADVNTASFLFQTGWSGRAEFGTTGDDDWHVKTSPDGSNWSEAIIADKDTGTTRFPSGLEHDASREALTGLVHTPGGNLEVSVWRFDVARGSTPRSAIISSISGDTISLTTPDAAQFYSESRMVGVSYVRIWNMSKSPEQSAWLYHQPNTTDIEVLDSADISGWLAGETIQIGEPASQIGTGVVAVDISPMMQNRLGAVFPQEGVLVKLTVSADNINSDLGISPTGGNGSFSNCFGQSSGSITEVQATIPTTVPSPISNSNLLFIREVDKSAGLDALRVGGGISVRVMGLRRRGAQVGCTAL